MRVDVVTPGGAVLESQATAVTVPTQMGAMTILEGHIPVIASLDLGLLTIKDGGDSYAFAVDGGFVEVGKERVSIVTETALRPEEVDADAENEKLAKYEAELKNVSALNMEEIALANRELKRATEFLKISKLS